MTRSDRSMEAYYERRAREYDDWYLGTGLFAERDRPGWEGELAALMEAVGALEPMRTLDVACGTAFLGRYLRGRVVGLDASEGMLRIARTRTAGPFVRSDGLRLPFRDASFGRVYTGHFYGHLQGQGRLGFLAEARRVAPELVVVDAALRDGVRPEETQDRVLSDGSRHTVYKRFFTPEQLIRELGGGEVLFSGRWFVMVCGKAR